MEKYKIKDIYVEYSVDNRILLKNSYKYDKDFGLAIELPIYESKTPIHKKLLFIKAIYENDYYEMEKKVRINKIIDEYGVNDVQNILDEYHLKGR